MRLNWRKGSLLFGARGGETRGRKDQERENGSYFHVFFLPTVGCHVDEHNANKITRELTSRNYEHNSLAE